MSAWVEIAHGEDRIRYRPRPGHTDRADGGAFEVEYWHTQRREWREIRSPSSRDLFALGMKAGAQAAGGTEHFDLFAGARP